MGGAQGPKGPCTREHLCVCQCRRSTLECLVLENGAQHWDVSAAGLAALFAPCSCLCAACSGNPLQPEGRQAQGSAPAGVPAEPEPAGWSLLLQMGA